jgi:hypothetical protein
MKESAHIYTTLRTSGRVQQPHYADESYLEGDMVETGFEVTDRPENPEHIVVHMGPQYIVDNSDMDSRFREAEQHEPKNVIHVGSTVRYLPPDEPDYMNPDRGREAKAEAAAQAVKAAILRGELDPSIFE